MWRLVVAGSVLIASGLFWRIWNEPLGETDNEDANSHRAIETGRINVVSEAPRDADREVILSPAVDSPPPIEPVQALPADLFFADEYSPVARTFLTQSPDVQGFIQSMYRLASVAEVGPMDGNGRGKLQFPDLGMTGTYRIRGGALRVTMRTNESQRINLHHSVRIMSLGVYFDKESGDIKKVASSVKFSPTLEVKDLMRMGATILSGYSGEFDEDGTRLTPRKRKLAYSHEVGEMTFQNGLDSSQSFELGPERLGFGKAWLERIHK